MKATTAMMLLVAGLAAGHCRLLHAQSAAPPAAATIRLAVDVTDLEHRVFHVRESLPATPGTMRLQYPQWLPGNHGPRGPIDALAGLTAMVDGRRVEWTRDPLDVYSFAIEVPHGAGIVELSFDYASPMSPEQGRVVATPEIVGLQWNAVVLYPADADASALRVEPSLRLPAGWLYASGMDTAARSDDEVRFAPVSLETLVDSPVFAGRHARILELTPDAKRPVRLAVFGDSDADLQIAPAQLDAHRHLIEEIHELFGSQHYDHYDFLLAVSDQFGRIGLEHHRSSENGVGSDYFTDWDSDAAATERSLLPHEMTHSWNGKFRRPADLWTKNFNTPMQDSLLWVYEGLTQYYGQVLAARSGLWSAEFARDALAEIAAAMDVARPGRQWRDLQDTTHQPIITARRPLSYVSWQRSEDYYNEGLLVWLDVDTTIRELTRNKRSLDDFAKRFFGVEDGRIAPLTYRFEDIVAALSEVAPLDWASMLRARLDDHGPDAPLDGLRRAGWRLVYTDTPSKYSAGVDKQRKRSDLSYSLGMIVDDKGVLSDVLWEGPAYRAGLGKGVSLVAVNGREYRIERLKQAITAAKDAQEPIELLVKSQDRYRTVRIDYHGGLRYPHLQRIDGSGDRLSTILASRR